MSESDEGGYLTSRQAIVYLAEKWGLEFYSLEAFRAYRRRKHVKPDLGTENAAFWKKETLDAIPKPDKSRGRPTKRKTEQNEDHSEKAA